MLWRSEFFLISDKSKRAINIYQRTFIKRKKENCSQSLDYIAMKLKSKEYTEEESSEISGQR